MQLHEMLLKSSGATFSECGSYRFVLWRFWNFSKPAIMFIGLNPSTANETKPDPTISRVVSISKYLGYGGVYMLNLFPFITPYPDKLQGCPAEAMKKNDTYIKEYAKKSKDIVFAWGGFETLGRDRCMMEWFPHAKALVINDDGTPQHPLYVPVKTIPVPYKPVL